jgi:hypothetical protein
VKISKTLRKKLVDAVREANYRVWVETLPQCVDTPPELWSSADKDKFDILTEFERKSIENIDKVLTN